MMRSSWVLTQGNDTFVTFNAFLWNKQPGFLNTIKAHVRELYYISGNLYPNSIVRHMLMKWTDYLLGI